MPNPYSIDLRERAVAAYETGEDSYAVVAARFSVSARSLERWVARGRDVGSVAAFKKGGGRKSPVDVDALEASVREKPDSTVDELTRAYNGRVLRRQRVHRSSVLRTLRRRGYVFKKNVPGPRKPTDPTSKPSAPRISRGSRR
jgi:transposase